MVGRTDGTTAVDREDHGVVRRPGLRGSAAAILLVISFAGGMAARAASDWPADVAAAPPADAGVESIVVLPSGNIRKEFGEPAGLVRPGGDESVFVLTLDDVAVVSACPGRGVEMPPMQGQFLVLDVTASMSAEVAEIVAGGAELFMPLVPEAFVVTGPAGPVTVETVTDASWACFDDSDLAAPYVGPGETTSGKVVLDSPIRSGTLVYAPAGELGWEWEFGQ